MNPPPPTFPAAGHVTANARAVATAASTAFPPWLSAARPTSLAGGETVTTMPHAGSAGCRPSRDAASTTFCALSAPGFSAPSVGLENVTATRIARKVRTRRLRYSTICTALVLILVQGK